MSPASLHTGFGILFTLLSVIGVLVLFWLALRRPAVRQPGCGNCGYAVEGLEVMSCPECGSDLRKVGIETPKRGMLHPGLFVLFFSLLLIVPFATAWPIAMRMGPRIVNADSTFSVSAVSGSMPDLLIDQHVVGSGKRRNVMVSSASMRTTVRDGVMETDIRFPMFNGAAVDTWTVEVRTVRDVEASIPTKLTLDLGGGETPTVAPAALDVVFGDGGTGSPEDVAEVAALLNALVKGDPSFSTRRLGMAGMNTVTSNSRTPGWYAPMLATIGLLIYGLGILVYAIVRRRRLAGSLTPRGG